MKLTQEESTGTEKKERPLYIRVRITLSDKLDFSVNGSVKISDARGNKAEIRNNRFVIKSSKTGVCEKEYYAILLASHDKDEVKKFVREFTEQGYDLKVKEKSVGRLTSTYFLYSGPYTSEKELMKHAPPNAVRIEEKTGENKHLPVFLVFNQKRYTLYGRILLKVKGELILKNITYSRGLSSEFRRDVVLMHNTVLLPDGNGKIVVIAYVPLEDYLLSVVKSEIGENAPLEAKKAQAVAARTNAIRKLINGSGFSDYDITSDVYSQVYQGGVTFPPSIKSAVYQTRGEILVYNGKPIEALFHAMCGGHTENSENVWSSYLPYLRGVFDRGKGHKRFSLQSDGAVKRWINGNPDINCRKYGKKYWRWSFSYTPYELGKIVKSKTGRDLGRVLYVKVLQRGVSGRARKIKIIGQRGSIVIKKDLNIRRALSYSSLPSSLFYIEKRGGKFIIKGRGFGHGVGMCQVGAMGMADMGYNYKEILKHYYSHVKLEKIY